jgi:hypothetical protein
MPFEVCIRSDQHLSRAGLPEQGVTPAALLCLPLECVPETVCNRLWRLLLGDQTLR